MSPFDFFLMAYLIAGSAITAALGAAQASLWGAALFGYSLAMLIRLIDRQIWGVRQ